MPAEISHRFQPPRGTVAVRLEILYGCSLYLVPADRPAMQSVWMILETGDRRDDEWLAMHSTSRERNQRTYIGTYTTSCRTRNTWSLFF